MPPFLQSILEHFHHLQKYTFHLSILILEKDIFKDIEY